MTFNYYIFEEEGNTVGFKRDDIHEIDPATDAPISKEDYEEFFKRERENRPVVLRNLTAQKFEDRFVDKVMPIAEEAEPTELELLRMELNELKKIINDKKIGESRKNPEY